MAESARELVRKLGTFLADLTQDRPADRIHADILDRLRDPDRPLDHRLAGVYLQDKDFVPIWTAIRNGASLPASSWETVILPTVVFYSTEQAVKANLETAIGLWRTARDALSEIQGKPVPIEASAPAPPPPLPLPLLDEAPEPEIIPWETDAPPSARSPRRRLRLLVPSAAGLTLVAVAALVLANYPAPTATPGPLPSTHVFPDPPAPSPVPSEEPSPSPTPSAEPTPEPSAPTSSSSMRTVSPSAPQSLASTGKTRRSVSLSWRAPAEPGTGGIERYRVFVNGQEVSSTTNTAATITSLMPDTSYTFTVKAYSRMGRVSPESSMLTVRTDKPGLSTPPSVPFGRHINVSGADWPCTIVNVYLDTHPVANPKTAADGFTDVIYVEPNGDVRDIATGDFFKLEPNSTWVVRASCAGLTTTTNVSIGAKLD